MKRFFFLIFPILFVTNQCYILYPSYPKQSNIPAMEKTIDEPLAYNLPNFPRMNLGGRDALKEYFDFKTAFKNVKENNVVPANGYLVDVKVDWESPSNVAVGFLALSTITLTLLPAWSQEEGYSVRYILYKSGAEPKTFKYRIYRNYYQFFFLLPFVPLNLETSTEREVFQKLTEKFFSDAVEAKAFN